MARQPLLQITAGEGADALRDLLLVRVLREFEEGRTFGWLLGHAVGSGAHPHQERRLLRFASAGDPVSLNRAARTRRSEVWRGCLFPSRSSRCARAIGPGTRDLSRSMRLKSARSDWPAVLPIAARSNPRTGPENA